MNKISVHPPSGFRDFTVTESALRTQIAELIAEKYRLHGFQQIYTPACENLTTLEGKGGGQDNEHLIFKILKRGQAFSDAISKTIGKAAESFAESRDIEFEGRILGHISNCLQESADSYCDLGLRFDLTLPLARYISRFRNDLPFPFKVFQMGPVWRAERAQKGRFREFIQCDVDIIGTAGIGAEIDCLQAVLSVFQALGINGLTVHINDRRLLSALGKKWNYSPDQWKDFLVSLDKRDKIGSDGVLAELSAKFGASEDSVRQFKTILQIVDASSDRIDLWQEYDAEACESLRQIIAATTSNFARVVFSPNLVRGQEYYTGTIFEIRHPDFEGSIGGGGRYDRLLELFGGQSTPAMGGSIGFERLFLLAMANNAAKSPTSVPKVFFPLLSPACLGPVLELASQLRNAGIATDVYPENTKLHKQFKYADSRKIPFAAILGENELTQGKITVKNMLDGTQTEFKLADFLSEIRKILS